MPDHQFTDVELAGLYDTFYPWDSREDLPFYLPMVMAAGSVLDIGCGTGTLLKAARDQGHPGRLCGLDPAIGMLESARRRDDIEWILGDTSTVAFENEFDLIVMSGHAFQVLVSDDEISSTLASIRSALSDSGLFAFETRNPTVKEWEHWNDESIDGITTDSGLTVLMRNRVDALEADRVSFTTTFWSPSWSEDKVSRSTLRFLDAGSLNAFLSNAGLEIVDQFGDWDQEPLTEHSPEIITTVRRG
jgi:ubiquinone/menaquinone biosynthesis C-methylase UbiE